MTRDPDGVHRLQRALAYPGSAPAGSFALGPGGAVSLDAVKATALAGEGETVSVLAYGSNAAPEHLQRKLGRRARVVALRAEVPGWDAVYSAHLASYGAVPATLWPNAGTVLRCHLLLLGPGELAALDASEPNYTRCPLHGVESALTAVGRPTGVWVYHSRHGALRVDGGPLAVAPVPSTGRRLAAADQAGVLANARDRLDPGRSLEDFVTRAVTDPELRASWTARLRADAVAPGAWLWSGRPCDTDRARHP